MDKIESSNKIDISVIIPTRNRRLFLSEAIESVIKQKSVNIELIIVDDASTDDTEEYVKLLRSKTNVKYIKNEKSLFAHESRRLGYEISTGMYIVFMDDDDFYIDFDFLYNAKIIFEEHKNVSLVIGSTIMFEKGRYSKEVDLQGSGLLNQKLYLNEFSKHFSKPLSTLTAVLRKENLDNLNMRNSKMVNDTCIYLNGIIGGDVFLINRSVAAYRVHENNISKKKFNQSFMNNCLNEKKRLYDIALKNNLLIDSKNWFYFQIRQSAYYFIVSSDYDAKTCIYILTWILRYGNGIRLKFVKEILHR